MPDLREKQRKAMPKGVFAYVDERGEGHLPLNDETRVRNAMARWNQTAFSSTSAKESARRAQDRASEAADHDRAAQGGASEHREGAASEDGGGIAFAG